MPDPTLVVTVDAASLANLKAGGYQLYAMVAASSSNKSGRPLIAWVTANYASRNQISLGADMAIYVSTSTLVSGDTVSVASFCSIEIGEMATIARDTTLTTSALSGLPTTMLISNQSGSTWTSGLSRNVSGTLTPTTGFDTGPGDTITLGPTQKIFLFFATSTYALGAVFTTSLSQGVVVDLSTASASPTIAYDVAEGGWITAGATWATIYPPGTSLTPLLIISPGTNVPRLL